MTKGTGLGVPLRWEGFGGERGDNGTIKILVVDDNDALRYSLIRSLKEAGYQIAEAKNGREALELAAESPDLITLDINLPDISGFQVCRQLKSASSTAHIPILHVSSTFVDPESRVKGLEGGADAYLAEPIDRAELVATVGALLRLKNAEIAARQQAAAAESARTSLAELNATLETRIKERTAELGAANDSLRELSARLLQIQDEERRRIARDLHDSVGQLLVAIKMNNATVKKESTVSAAGMKVLEENDSLVKEVLQSIRTISHLLHPPLLDEAGLRSALLWYIEEFSKRSGISVTLDCPARVERLSSELETAIFRIVQECLGNVHRHSGSRTASVHLEIKEGRISLHIKDDGAGIPPARQHEIKSHGRIGVGLRGIRERIAQFGGTLDIASSSEGTTISAVLPCHPAGLAASQEAD